MCSARSDGDTRFPAIDPDIWEIVSEQDFPAGEKDYARDALHRLRDGARKC